MNNELLEILNDNLEKYKVINDKQYNNLLKWFVSLSNYILSEEKQDKYYTNFKRGNIIRADFGFNIGHELGGMHYAIVLDVKNSINSGLVTVVPLTSKKKDNVFYTKIDLDTEFYELMSTKTNSIAKELESLQSELTKAKYEADNLISSASPDNYISFSSDDYFGPEYPTINKWFVQFSQTEKYPHITHSSTFDFDEAYNEMDKLVKKYIHLNRKLTNELASMKKGTIVNVDQITTISKDRIYNPRHRFDTLYKLKISNSSLDKINNKLKELFIFDK